MSHTTDITLLLGTLDDSEGLQAFNAQLEKAGVVFANNIPYLRGLDAAIRNLPGSKCYTDLVAAACWNNAGEELDILAREFNAFDWASPENAILIIACEQGRSIIHRPTAYRGEK